MSGVPSAWCFVGGRRRYNARRKELRRHRRAQIISRIVGVPLGTWGLQAALAAVFGVSRSTICRDFKAIRNADRGALLA